MSLEAITWAYKTQVGGPAQKAVLLVLANYADENDSAYPGIVRIARMTQLSERTVQRAVAELEEDGVIAVEREVNKTNRYHLDLEWTGGGDTVTPGGGDTVSGGGVTVASDTKETPREGHENTKRVAPRHEVSGKNLLTKRAERRRLKAEQRKEYDYERDAEVLGTDQDVDDTPAEVTIHPGIRGIAQNFQHAARRKWPKGDSRRFVNQKALRMNLTRWHNDDGIPLEELARAAETFFDGNYVREGDESWRRFINLFARMHTKATAPDITDPAYYTDSQEKENIEWTVEAWLEAQGQPSSGPS